VSFVHPLFIGRYVVGSLPALAVVAALGVAPRPLL
jgi:hypothetical protein